MPVAYAGRDGHTALRYRRLGNRLQSRPNAPGLEISVPTESYAHCCADDGKPFTPPAHADWEKQLFAKGLRFGFTGSGDSHYRPGEHYYHLEILSPEPIPDYPANVAHALGAKAWSSPIWVQAVQ